MATASEQGAKIKYTQALTTTQWLRPEHLFCRINFHSQKALFEHAAHCLGRYVPEIKPQSVVSKLMFREKLGSTSIGNGIAIPHCTLDDLIEPFIWLSTLKSPLKFNAEDTLPVDITAIVIIPNIAHDQTTLFLTNFAYVIQQARSRNRLRKAKNHQELCASASLIEKEFQQRNNETHTVL